MTDYSKYTLGREERFKFIFVIIIAFFGLSYVFYESFLPTAAILFMYKPLEKKWSVVCSNKRKCELLLQFKDLLYSLSSSFATGRHMKEGLMEARDNLSMVYGEEGYIVRELDQMIDKMENTRDTDVQVIRDFAMRSHLEDVRNFSEVFSACRETGGDLVTAMNKTARVIGEKITIENDIRTMVSQKRFEGKIITVMPIVITLFLKIMSPDYLAVMYQSLAGRILMTMALITAGASYLWIERIIKIEV